MRLFIIFSVVDTGTLRAFMKTRGLSQSELARQVGVSRQAVSLWFAQGSACDIHGRHLLGLTRALGVSLEDLAAPLPALGPEVHVELLWDHLFPDLESLAAAALREDARAWARLAEVYGLYRTAAMLGEAAWSRFPAFKRFIPPARRRDLERVWLLRSNPG